MLKFRSVARTDVGKVRSLNEDNLLARDDLGLWCVADGMGGHEAGDVASTSIVNALSRIPQPTDGRQFFTAVRNSLRDVNRDLWEQAGSGQGGRTIGSTVVAFLVFEGEFVCAWAGDSRCYRYRRGQLEPVSRDHSLVQQLVDNGMLSEEEAKTHPDGNVITRAIGASENVELETRTEAVMAGDLFLLCTDGLTKMLEDDEIARIIAMHETIDQAADSLLARTLERGAKDNVSLVLVQARSDPTVRAADDETVGTQTFALEEPVTRERRRDNRQPTSWPGQLQTEFGPVPCTVRNYGQDGFLIELGLDGDLGPGPFTLHVDLLGCAFRVRTVWQRGRAAGMEVAQA